MPEQDPKERQSKVEYNSAIVRARRALEHERDASGGYQNDERLYKIVRYLADGSAFGETVSSISRRTGMDGSMVKFFLEKSDGFFKVSNGKYTLELPAWAYLRFRENLGKA